ncbi:MAG: PAS domain S-box protein [Chloroflexota bacterium]|nr:MAG: PAS domain S-box protein [Chloroflexota bacterium]
MIDVWMMIMTQRKTGRLRKNQARSVETQLALLEQGLELVEQAAIIFNPQGQMTFANGPACSLLDISSRDFLEADPGLLGKAYSPEGTQLPFESFTLPQSSSVVNSTEKEIYLARPDGSQLDVIVHTTPLQTPDGNLFGTLVTLTDNTAADRTEEKWAIERLSQNEALYRAIARNIPDGGVIVVDPNMTGIVAEGALFSELGMSKETVEGFRISEIREDTLRLFHQNYFQIALSGEAVSHEMERNGRTIWTKFAPLVNEQGQITAAIALSLDISERKRAEGRIQRLYQDLEQRNAELDAERMRWQGVVEGIADEVWVCDAQGKMSLINLASVTAMGLEAFKDWPVEKVLEEVEILYLDGQPRPPEQAPLLRSLAGEIVRGEEIMRHRQTGIVRYRQYSSAPLRGETGLIVGAVAIVRDITEAKQVEAELHKAHRQTVEILESIGDGFYHVDKNWRFTYINHQAEMMWNKRREDLLGKVIWDIFQEQEGSASQKAHYQAAQEQRPVYLETRSPVLDTWITISLYPSADGLSVYFRDIGEQKRAEEELRLSEERFSKAFQATPDALIIIRKKDGLIIDVNTSFEKIFEYSREEAIGKTAQELGLFSDPSAHQALMGKIRQEQTLQEVEVEVQALSGQVRQVTLSTETLDIHGEACTLTIVHDITARKNAEKIQANYAHKLERSNQELQEFAYVASHDLQEPLRKVSAFGKSLNQMLQDKLSDDEREHFERLLKAATRMQDMINDLLELSRVTTQGKPFQKVELCQVAEEVVSDLDVRISNANGRVEIGDLPIVEADQIQMERLLMNLIGNALKYHREDVPPVIRVSGDRIRVKGSEWVEIRVEDNGIGFDMEFLGRIFQPFQRLHGRSQYEGTGMGLAICKKIAERHGGSITARSEPGKGSIFIVTLPV